jgi:hypothetical protein
MKSAERDDLLVRQVEAAEKTTQFSMRFAQAMERSVPRDEEERAAWEAMRHPPRRIFDQAGGVGLLLKFIPGFAALWDREIPESHLASMKGRDGSTTPIVVCPCGGMTALEELGITECSNARWRSDDPDLFDPSGCTRAFLRLEESIRVHRFGAEQAATA